MILRLPLMHLFPAAWNRFELSIAYTQERRSWVWAVAAASAGIVGYTWYQYVITDTRYSMVLVILVTVTLVKLSQLLFNYSRFRGFAEQLLAQDRRKVLVINVLTALAGAALIWAGIAVY